MKNQMWFVLAALIILIFLLSRSGSSYAPPKYISDGFIGLCPPGQMLASYTTEGGDCVQIF